MHAYLRFQEYRYSELILLLKIIIGLGENPVWLGPEAAAGYSAENIPGGLAAKGIFNEIPISIEDISHAVRKRKE